MTDSGHANAETQLTVVPDTNILLHCLPLDQIPWPKFLGVPRVDLVLVPQVLREMDEKKSSDSDHLRERARRFSSAIGRWLPPGTQVAEIAEGVSLRVDLARPAIAPGIEHPSGDDLIIASAMALGCGTLLASGDVLMRLSAEANGLRVVTVPDEYRIAEGRPRKQSAPTKSANLVVGLLDDAVVQQHLALPVGINPSDYRVQMEERVSLVKRGVKPMSYLLGPAFDQLGIPAPTLRQFEDFVDKLRGFERKLRTLVEFQVAIENTGEAPAEDVQAEFVFPTGMEITDRPPTWPARPDLPECRSSGSASPFPFVPTAERNLTRAMDWTDAMQRRRLRLRVGRLMQTRLVSCRLWATIAEPGLRGFGITGRVLVASPPLTCAVELNIKLNGPPSVSISSGPTQA